LSPGPVEDDADVDNAKEDEKIAYEPSSYEKLREEKVKRNTARLESLGLVSRRDDSSRKETLIMGDIDYIKDHRKASKEMGGWELLVRWKGNTRDTWEPIYYMKKQVRGKVNKYMSAHPDVFKSTKQPVRRNPTRSKAGGTRINEGTDASFDTEDTSCSTEIQGGKRKSKEKEDASEETIENPLPTRKHTAHNEVVSAIAEDDEESTIVEAATPTPEKEIANNEATSHDGPSCHHDTYEMTNYKEETNSKYCKSGSKFYLADVRCAICKDMFTSTEKTKRGQCFKPSLSKPLYACVNSLTGCRHAICYFCFHEKLLSSDDS